MNEPIWEHHIVRRWWLLALLGSLPFVFDPVALDPVLFIRNLGVGLATLVGLLISWTDRRILLSLIPTPLHLLWGIYLLVSLLGIPFAHNPMEASWDVLRLCMFTGLFYLFVLAAHGDKRWIAFVLPGLVLINLLLGSLGAFQVLQGEILWWPDLGGIPSGSMGARNYYASALLLLLPLTLASLFRSSWIWQVLAVVSVLLDGWMLWTAKSAAAMLGLGVVGIWAVYVAVVWWLERKYAAKPLPLPFRPFWRRIILVGMMLLAVVVAYQVFAPQQEVVQSGDFNQHSDSGLERLVLWENSWEMLKKRPLLGVGPGNWKFHILEQGVVSQYQGFATRYFIRAHNDFVQAFAERGWVGGLAWLGFIVVGIFLGLRQFEKAQDPAQKWLLAGALGGLLAWTVVANFSFPFERPFHFTLLFLFLSLVISTLPRSGPAKERGGGLWIPLLLFTSLAVLGAFFNFSDSQKDALLFKYKGRQDWGGVVHLAERRPHWFSYDRSTFTPYSWYEGNAQLNLGDNEAAKTSLTRAYEVHPWHPQVLSNYGTALAATGELQKSTEILEGLLARYPDFNDARKNLTELYLALGDRNGALRTIAYWEKIGNPHSFSVYLNSVQDRLKLLKSDL